MIYVCDKESGRIIQAVDAHDSHRVHYAGDGVEVNVLDKHIDQNEFYFIDGNPVAIGDPPSSHHKWDWYSRRWIPDVSGAQKSLMSDVARQLSLRLYAPCNGFDADSVSRERIAGMIARLQRGDGLPAGWSGWRDASNVNRWADSDASAVLENLTALSRAIEDREQALLVASWTHKANIAALTDIDTILSYDVTANWPV